MARDNGTAAGKPPPESGPVRTLSTTGVTINAMALIAPGAFLWITYQLQAAQVGPDGKTSTSPDMWTGIVFALVVAFLTAISYAEMAKVYPEAGYGSAYYFADRTFMDKATSGHQRWARLAKLITGWAAHLFYWVYPGVMVAFMAVIITYICGLFGLTLSTPEQMAVAVVFALLCGFIAMRGINGSTLTSFIVNIIQLVTLIGFSILGFMYRAKNPDHILSWAHSSASSIVLPHSVSGVLFQASIAILILVGFESCTALGAEAKDPKRSVPQGVILSLVIQGLFAYLIEYFAANYALGTSLTSGTGKELVTGMDAAAKSSAPIGDLVRLFGDRMLGGIGFGLCVTMAVTVALAILGTTLACLNTGVRVSYAMAKDKEMPEIISLMHGKFGTPVAATWVLTILSALIGAYGCTNVVALTGIGIASNLGTFILYMLICVWTIIAFHGRHERSHFLHMLIPILGFICNALMIGTIFYLAFAAGGDSKKEGLIALGFAAVWAIISLIYVVVSSARSGRKLIHADPTLTANVAQL